MDRFFEEAQEVRDAPPENRYEVLADLLEVVQALASHLGLTDATLSAVAVDKWSQRGGVEKRNWLE